MILYHTFDALKPVCLTDESSNIYYVLSKVCIILSLIIAYVFIVLKSAFTKELISIYELISFSIIIPVMVDLISKKKYKA